MFYMFKKRTAWHLINYSSSVTVESKTIYIPNVISLKSYLSLYLGSSRVASAYRGSSSTVSKRLVTACCRVFFIVLIPVSASPSLRPQYASASPFSGGWAHGYARIHTDRLRL